MTWRWEEGVDDMEVGGESHDMEDGGLGRYGGSLRYAGGRRGQ